MRRVVLLFLAVSACSREPLATDAVSQDLCLSRCAARVDGGSGCCAGLAYSDLPPDSTYFLTTFGGGVDTGPMSCGGVADGCWWYAADRQRFGCGTVVRLTANGRCALATVMDYGPGTCVEDAACGPVLDASPLVARQLFGVSSAGWSEHRAIRVDVHPPGTPTGPCVVLADGGIEFPPADAGVLPPSPLPRGGGCAGLGTAVVPLLGLLLLTRSFSPRPPRLI